MKRICKIRIYSLILIIAVLFVTASPVFAADDLNNAVSAFSEIGAQSVAEVNNLSVSNGVLGATYSGSWARLDAPNGKLIGRAILESTGNWSTEGSLTVPLLSGVTGIHSVYIMVENSVEQANTNKAGNLKSFTLAEAEGNYLLNTINNLTSYDVVLTATEDSEVDEVQLIIAAYDKDGCLKAVDMDAKTPVSGEVTVYNASVEKSAVSDLEGGYTIKAFAWDGNIAPLSDFTLIADTTA